MTTVPTRERELTAPVDLCTPDGRLNREAVGWCRTPLVRGNVARSGRRKRWEYWAVQTPDLVLAVTVSDLEYAALHAVWALTPDDVEHGGTAIVPLGRGADLGDRAGLPARARAKGLEIDLDPQDDGGTRLQVRTPDVAADVVAAMPAGHESMGVVVPWSRKRFQYTVKDNTRPAAGWVRVDGVTYDLPAGESWATLDHGRGRWPYRITWNWGSGSGRTSDGRPLGLQVGGRWTDGTGSTENAVCVAGRLSKLGADLWWEYDTADWMRPWRVRDVRDGRLDLVLEPRHVRSDHTELGVVGSTVHQCFGTWRGWVVADDGERIEVDGVRGWAEEARQRW